MTMDMHADLEALNKREPKHTLILRLLAEAETPRPDCPRWLMRWNSARPIRADAQ